MEKELKNTGDIEIYKTENGMQVEVKLADDTVWLNQQQIAEIFGVKVPAVNKHINNIYNERELEKGSTVSKMEIVQKEGKRTINRLISHYNLDMIISVGYRVNSKQGTQFRIWATQRLKDYLLKGYAINQQRLQKQSLNKVKELENALKLIQNAIATKQLEGYEKEVLNIVTDYATTWTLLYQYDEDKLQTKNLKTRKSSALDYDKVKNSIQSFKTRLIKQKQAGQIFGKEVSYKLQALLGSIEQTYNGKPLYKSREEKASHVLYFAIKDHPFADGNKRIGSLMFLLYLIENDLLYNRRGERVVSDDGLTALALLIAESKPSQKDTLVALIANLIKR